MSDDLAQQGSEGAREFLLREYEQCWGYIKFHYEQRDHTGLAWTGLVFLVGLGLVFLGSRLF